MSITRLQQARQMYAMGQRVAKTLDGSRPGYGGGADMGDQGTGGYQGGEKGGYGDASPSNDGPSNDGPDNNGNNKGGGADPMPSTPVTETFPSDVKIVDTIMDSPNIGASISFNPLDFKEQYRLGNKPFDSSSMYTNNPYAVGIADPYMTLGLEKQRKDNYIDALNLAGETYQGINVPLGVPGGMIINTVGNFLGGIGDKKNRQFFADNVAGKYGFGYDMNAYKDYMKKRMAGEVGAYGNENMGQNAINARAAQGDSTQGIMDVAVDDTTDDTTTDDELILRFLGADSTLDPAAAGLASTDELRAMLLERARNLYT